MALTCKAGFDFWEIEMKGGELVLDVDNRDEGGKESEGGSDQDEEDIPASSQPTSALESGAALPSSTLDLSRAP
ncbi:uncharacterized protein A4U43_C04F3090 [Asparagus officinalis]|uniref:Uncharacterized protein n=1 Tax=Asparagus officinalis TaxID=4686 RepID=A0A5P1F2K5_ASPOF|nr:uncharacterized protein A4U43_C04F3090 [Asparagus officinalis]